MSRDTIKLPAILIILSVVQSAKSAHLVEVVERITTTENNWETTTTEPETELPIIINPWIGRKIGSENVLKDLINEERKTENDIPTEIEEEKKEERHPCYRKCVEDEAPMLCRYHFKVEWYQTLSKACFDCPYNKTDCGRTHCIAGDGVKRPILVVNRQMPGPAVEVCLNDEVIVEVENALMEEGTSVHWHGHHQRGTPFMDGVPFVTQCPIYPKSTFTYRYKADTAGTHFWHSHSALQRGDGMFGALVVRVPDAHDPHLDLFDYDLSQHMMVILDWTHAPGISKFVAHHHSNGNNKPEGILVNGKGRYVEFEDVRGDLHMTPIERFNVKQGFRYRFRIINAGFLNCPIEMSIDNHTMVIVSSDGSDLEPEEATSLVTYAGERFDIIVEMKQPVDNYWIRYRGLMDCDERFTSAIQTAVLHYKRARAGIPDGVPTYENSAPKGLQVNSLNSGFQWNGSLSVPEMKSLSTHRDPSLKPEADFKFFIAYDFYPLDNPFMHKGGHYGFNQVDRSQRVFTPQMNHISMKLPSFPLMVELEAANQLNFCNDSSPGRDCTKEFCECTHLLRVPLGAVAEIILVDKGFTYDANHPFHLHGHAFRVIGMDRLGSNVTVEQVKKLDAEGKLRRNFDHPPIKDTITVPDGGYTVVRWHATNPGYWLFHCHIEYHVELGMAIVFKVGEDSDYPPVPPSFPRCNNFTPHKTTTSTETPVIYKNFNKSIISEIEFAIDNTLNYLARSRTSTFTSNSVLLVFLIFCSIVTRI